MKKIMGLLVFMAVAAFCFSTAPAIADDEGIGEYASDAGHIGKGKTIPPGHYGIVASYLDQLLSSPVGVGGKRHLFTSMLTDGVDDPNLADELSDFFIVDVRTPAEYCAGTVPGAINIPVATLAKAENLAKLPVSQPILLVCNTGHQAISSVVALGTLGYDVWTLRFGMSSWKKETKVPIWNPSVTSIITGANKPMQVCQ